MTLRMSENAIRHNTQVKLYPDGSAGLLCLERPLIRERGWEEQKPRRNESDASDDERSEEQRRAESRARSQRRARTAVFDLARCNPLDWFVTLTVDAAKLDRYDHAAVFEKVHSWLDNRVRRNGLAYVLIPELHKDGAIHFHALMNGALPMEPSGTYIMPEGGRPRRAKSKTEAAAWLTAGAVPVYNLPSWKWGFSTAIMLHGERDRAVGYVAKYITKSADKIGGRWYYSGGDLRRPEVFTADLDFEKVCSNDTKRGVFEIPELGCRAIKLEVGRDLDAYLGEFA